MRSTGLSVRPVAGSEIAAAKQFCRRGQMQQKTVKPVAGMPETGNGAKSHRPVDEATRLPES
jgi:hypothetical protein